MIETIFILSFLIETCFSETASECVSKISNTQSGITSQSLFDDSLKAFYEKNFIKASEGFDAIIKCGEEPWKRRSIFMSGRTYLESGKKEEAKELFLKAISEYEELADYSLYYLSESLLAAKDYERAIETLRLLYKTYTKSPLKGIAQFKEAKYLYLSGKYSEAVRSFETFLTENTNDPMVSEARLFKGKALKEMGMMEEALDTFKKLWIEDPASASADRVLEELVSVRLSVEDYLLRAENLFKVSLYSKALLDLQKALELEEDHTKNSEIRLRTGIALFKLRRYDEAIGVINKVLSQKTVVKEVSKRALYYLGRVHLRKGNKDRFFKTSNEYYRLYPEDKRTPEVLLLMADELRRSGERERALATYNLIINEYPDVSADALYQKGWIEYLSGNFEKSSKDMRLLVERHPESSMVPQALYWEARGYEKSGNRSKADVIFRGIIKEYPSNFYGYLARKRLGGNNDLINPLDQKKFKSFSYYSASPSEITFPKVRELKILGMKAEAVTELDYLRNRYVVQTAHTPENLETLIEIGRAYINLGEYKIAISMADGHTRRDKRFIYLLYPLGFWSFINESFNETMMDPYLLAAVIREESRFDPKAISRAGAMGLMQVIPSTWKWISKQLHKIEIQNPKSEFRTLNSELRNDSDPFDPRENISRGSRYLRYLFDKFNRNLIIALSAYNAGPETVNSWLTNRSVELDEFIEEIPYKETKAYLKRVLRSYGEYQRIYNCSAKIDSQREFSCL